MIRPKTTRILVMVTQDERGPGQLPFDRTPEFGVFGDNVEPADRVQAFEYAAEVRRSIDAEGRVGWVWIGHDGAFLCDFWVWFGCLGPQGWTSDKLERSERSFAKLENDRKAEEKAKWDSKYDAKGKKKAAPKGKKPTSAGDDIVDIINERR